MPSFRIALSRTERAGGRFILAVRRGLQKAFAEENKKRGITQSHMAREIGVHRSVINRELRGEKDITLSRVGELARALGRRAVVSFPEIQVEVELENQPAAERTHQGAKLRSGSQ